MDESKENILCVYSVDTHDEKVSCEVPASNSIENSDPLMIEPKFDPLFIASESKFDNPNSLQANHICLEEASHNNLSDFCLSYISENADQASIIDSSYGTANESLKQSSNEAVELKDPNIIIDPQINSFASSEKNSAEFSPPNDIETGGVKPNQISWIMDTLLEPTLSGDEDSEKKHDITTFHAKDKLEENEKVMSSAVTDILKVPDIKSPKNATFKKIKSALRCLKCDFSTKWPSHLRIHYKKHNVGTILICQTCNFSTCNQKHMTSHASSCSLSAKRSEKRGNSKGLCTKKGNSKVRIKYKVMPKGLCNIEKLKENVSPVICKKVARNYDKNSKTKAIVSKEFKKKTSFQPLLKFKHTKERKSLNCPFCTYSSKYSSTLRRHKLRHVREHNLVKNESVIATKANKSKSNTEVATGKIVTDNPDELSDKLADLKEGCLNKIKNKNLKEKRKDSLDNYASNSLEQGFSGNSKKLNDSVVKLSRSKEKKKLHFVKNNSLKETKNVSDKKVNSKESSGSSFVSLQIQRNENIFSCLQCLYKSKWRSNMYRHYKVHHGSILKHKKGKYSYLSNQKENVSIPSRKSKLGSSNPIVKIEALGKNFLPREKHEKSPDKELKFGSDQKKYNCLTCNFKTQWKSALHRHAKILGHTALFYSCSQCPFKTDRLEIKRDHLSTHKKLKFRCSKCQFKAHDNAVLKQHIALYHSNLPSNALTNLGVTKEFTCTLCPYASKSKWKLIRHEKSHKNRNLSFQFKCKYCIYGCNKANLLKAHLEKYNHMNHYYGQPVETLSNAQTQKASLKNVQGTNEMNLSVDSHNQELGNKPQTISTVSECSEVKDGAASMCHEQVIKDIAMEDQKQDAREDSQTVAVTDECTEVKADGNESNNGTQGNFALEEHKDKNSTLMTPVANEAGKAEVENIGLNLQQPIREPVNQTTVSDHDEHLEPVNQTTVSDHDEHLEPVNQTTVSDHDEHLKPVNQTTVSDHDEHLEPVNQTTVSDHDEHLKPVNQTIVSDHDEHLEPVNQTTVSDHYEHLAEKSSFSVSCDTPNRKIETEMKSNIIMSGKKEVAILMPCHTINGDESNSQNSCDVDSLNKSENVSFRKIIKYKVIPIKKYKGQIKSLCRVQSNCKENAEKISKSSDVSKVRSVFQQNIVTKPGSRDSLVVRPIFKDIKTASHSTATPKVRHFFKDIKMASHSTATPNVRPFFKDIKMASHSTATPKVRPFFKDIKMASHSTSKVRPIFKNMKINSKSSDISKVQSVIATGNSCAKPISSDNSKVKNILEEDISSNCWSSDAIKIPCVIKENNAKFTSVTSKVQPIFKRNMNSKYWCHNTPNVQSSIKKIDNKSIFSGVSTIQPISEGNVIARSRSSNISKIRPIFRKRNNAKSMPLESSKMVVLEGNINIKTKAQLADTLPTPNDLKGLGSLDCQVKTIKKEPVPIKPLNPVGASPQKLVCSECGYQTSFRSNYRRHCSQHTKEKCFDAKVLSDKFMERLGAIKHEHLKVNFSKSNVKKCSSEHISNEEFYSKSMLRKCQNPSTSKDKNSEFITSGKPHESHVFEVKQSSNANLKVKKEKSKSKSLSCDYCNFNTSVEKSLKKHILTCTAMKDRSTVSPQVHDCSDDQLESSEHSSEKTQFKRILYKQSECTVVKHKRLKTEKERGNDRSKENNSPTSQEKLDSESVDGAQLESVHCSEKSQFKRILHKQSDGTVVNHKRSKTEKGKKNDWNKENNSPDSQEKKLDSEEKRFEDNASEIKHKRVDFKYYCSKCAFKTPNLKSITRHKLRHQLQTMKRFKCSKCVYGSNSENLFRKHQLNFIGSNSCYSKHTKNLKILNPQKPEMIVHNVNATIESGKSSTEIKHEVSEPVCNVNAVEESRESSTEIKHEVSEPLCNVKAAEESRKSSTEIMHEVLDSVRNINSIEETEKSTEIKREVSEANFQEDFNNSQKDVAVSNANVVSTSRKKKVMKISMFCPSDRKLMLRPRSTAKSKKSSKCDSLLGDSLKPQKSKSKGPSSENSKTDLNAKVDSLNEVADTYHCDHCNYTTSQMMTMKSHKSKCPNKGRRVSTRIKKRLNNVTIKKEVEAKAAPDTKEVTEEGVITGTNESSNTCQNEEFDYERFHSASKPIIPSKISDKSVEKNTLDETVLKCLECEFFTTCPSKVSEHSSHHRKSCTGSVTEEFKCSLCSYFAPSNTALLRHIIVNHPPVKASKIDLLACSKCNFKASDPSDLESHYAAHHKVELKELPEIKKEINEVEHDVQANMLEKCEKLQGEINFEANKFEKLQEQINFNVDELNNIEKLQNINSSLERNMNSECKNRCSINKSINTIIEEAKKIYKNTNQGSEEEKSLVAKDMTKSNTSSDQGQTPIFNPNIIIKTEEGVFGRIYKCLTCPYETKEKFNLQLHVKAFSHDAFLFSCTKCSFVGKTKEALLTHKLCHTMHNYCCPHCDFKTPLKRNLIQHTASSHGK